MLFFSTSTAASGLDTCRINVERNLLVHYAARPNSIGWKLAEILSKYEPKISLINAIFYKNMFFSTTTAASWVDGCRKEMWNIILHNMGKTWN
jgi:hypothetical protein